MQIPVIKRFQLLEVKNFLIIFYLVGLLGFIIPFTQPIFKTIIPLGLILNFLILIHFHKNWNIKFILLCSFIAILSFFIEMAGVKYGIIFGSYSYGNTMGLKVFSTPILIGFNWLMLSYCTHIIFKPFRINVILKVIFAASFMLFYDLLIEQAAPKLEMWYWVNNIIPLQNYISWFLFALLFNSLFYFFKIDIKNEIAPRVFYVQLMFFAALFLFHYFI